VAQQRPSASTGAAAAPAGRLAIPFSLSGGPICRSWDDFLVLAAQRWQALCDELSSGRLADYVRKLQRPDLVPRMEKGRSVDDQLDEWLGRLPVSRPSGPELDVYPESFSIRAVAGGGLTRQTLRVTNVGYRLLRSTVRVEPAGSHWLRLPAESNGRPFATIDQTDLTIELDLPETLGRPLDAAIVIESNGGTRRVPVRAEKAVAVAELPPAGPATGAAFPRFQADYGARLARVGPIARVLLFTGAAILLRFIVVLAALLWPAAGASTAAQARLSSVAVVLVGAGALVAGMLTLRLGEPRDVPAAALTGGSLGLLAAAVCFAIIQSVERVLGSWSSSIWAVSLLWGAIGALLALASNHVFPYRTDAANPETAS
jgi:hypothetical protein